MTQLPRRRGSIRHRTSTQPSSWRETAAVLALFAVLLSAIAGFMPSPSDAFGITADDPASLCVPGGGTPNDHDPGPSGVHHSCPCCLTHPLKWAAIAPTFVGLAPSVILATDRPTIADPAPPVARPHADSRPRAPPFAA